MWLFVGLAGRSVWKRHRVYLSKCVFTVVKGSRFFAVLGCWVQLWCVEKSLYQTGHCATVFSSARCVCMWRRVYPWGLSFDVGVSVCAHLASMELGERSFFLRNSTQHSKHSIRSRCVCSCMYSNSTPPSPSHHHKTPSSRLSPIFISPLLSRYLFQNLCSECQRKMERSLLVSLLCVWALSSLSAASGECVCVRGCLRKKLKDYG